MTGLVTTENTGNTQGAIKLILETDAIIQPITGIGRYTFELLRAFHNFPQIEDLRCMDRGRWKKPGSILQTFELENYSPAIPAPPERWHKNPAKAVLRRLLPRIQTLRLNHLSDNYIYHSPNYRLAPYKGNAVVTLHDLSIIRYPQFHPKERLEQLTPALERSVIQADHIITDSETVRLEVISHYGLDEKKITAVHLASSFDTNLVDTSTRDRYLGELGLNPGSYFLFTSTLEPRKNVMGLLRAYRALPEQTRQHYPLVLAGQLGWKSDDIRAELSRPATAKQVLHIGYVSNRQLSHLYSGARAFVYPTYYEGFGLPPIEAQSFAIPVVTSKRSCLPEVAGDGAILVDPDDCDELSTAMLRLVEDESLHTDLARNAEDNTRRFSWQKTASRTLDVYQRVMNG